MTAISAGNHAIAVAYAAQKLGVPAKVVMLASANPARLALARSCGAEVLLAPDGATGFAMVADIQASEGKFFVHPFNGLRTILGTATLGAEWAEQSAQSPGGLDALVLPIGGGGLAAGVATAFKLAMPGLAIYGVLRVTLGIRLTQEQEYRGADLSLHSIGATPEEDVSGR